MTARHFADMQTRADLAALQARCRAVAGKAALLLAGVIMGATLMAAAMIERGWTEAVRMQLEAGE